MGGACTRPKPPPTRNTSSYAPSSAGSTDYGEYVMPSIIDALGDDGDKLGSLPKIEPKSRPRPLGDRRRAATWQKTPAVLDDPSDSASTLTRANAALLAQSLCSARGVTSTRFPTAAAPSPRPSVTPRSPSLADIFGAAAVSAHPTVTPIRLEDRFAAASAPADAPAA